MNNSLFSFVFITALIGALITVFARSAEKRRKGWVSTPAILYRDFTFSEYATLNLVSLCYAGAVGFLTGGGIGFAVLAILSADYRWSYVSACIGCFLSIPFARISAEGYAVVFKTARDVSLFARLSSKSLVKNDPLLGERSNLEDAKKEERTKNMFSEILDEFD